MVRKVLNQKELWGVMESSQETRGKKRSRRRLVPFKRAEIVGQGSGAVFDLVGVLRLNRGNEWTASRSSRWSRRSESC